jgi:hypothetical protein
MKFKQEFHDKMLSHRDRVSLLRNPVEKKEGPCREGQKTCEGCAWEADTRVSKG